MALTAFTSRLGIGQGRVERDGEIMFVLGENEVGRLFDLAPGDHVEVVQGVDVTGAKLLRAQLLLRVPASLPDGSAWEASIVVDGVKRARTVGRPGRERLITDLAANVSKLSGVYEVGVRLELVQP